MDTLEQNLDAKQEETIRKRLQTSPLNKFLPPSIWPTIEERRKYQIQHLEVKLEESLNLGDSLG